MLTRVKKAQNTLEYAMIIAVVVGALVAAKEYMQRSVQGRLKESTDSVGEQFDAEGTYSKDWKIVSSGSINKTKEERGAKTGSIVTTIEDGEIITTGETEKWTGK